MYEFTSQIYLYKIPYLVKIIHCGLYNFHENHIIMDDVNVSDFQSFQKDRIP